MYTLFQTNIHFIPNKCNFIIFKRNVHFLPNKCNFIPNKCNLINDLYVFLLKSVISLKCLILLLSDVNGNHFSIKFQI